MVHIGNFRLETLWGDFHEYFIECLSPLGNECKETFFSIGLKLWGWGGVGAVRDGGFCCTCYHLDETIF